MDARSDRWLVSKVSDGFQLFARCVSDVGIDAVAHDSVSLVYHSPTGTGPQTLAIAIIKTEGTWQWRVRVAWAGAASLDHLDEGGVCRGCGKKIVDARVTEKGRILISHIE